MQVNALPETNTNPPGFFNALDIDPPPKPQPRGSDAHPLRAEISPDVAFSAEIMGDRPVEMMLGESVRFASPPGIEPGPLVGALWQVVRAPARSKAELKSSRLTPDLPGCYVVTCTLGGAWTRVITLACFPPAALEQVGYLPTQRLERRSRLRAIVRDPSVTVETIVAGLEGADVSLATVAGYGEPGRKRGTFNPEVYRK